MNEEEKSQSNRRSLIALDVLNFTAADIANGLGPFLAIFLLKELHWAPGQIGVAMAAQSISGIIVQIPLSAWIDFIVQKRWIIAIACFLIANAVFFMIHFPLFGMIIAGQLVIGFVWVVYQPTIGAISLGMVGYQSLPGRMGRNEAFNHTGNVFSAILSGIIGKIIAFSAVFDLMVLQSLISIAVVLMIRQKDIDPNLARGGEDGKAPEQKQISVEGLKQLLQDRRIFIFIVSVMIFHFANAAMLPLVSQILSIKRPEWSSVSTAACITAAQFIMIPVAIFTSRLANSWGRKPVFALGFAFLILRGVLYTFNSNPYYLVTIQALDGVGAGIYGVLGGVIASDLAQGTGRFNLMQGLVITALGVGAALSNISAGVLAQWMGYNLAFLMLAGIAAIGLVFFLWKMPETKPA